MLDRRRSCLWFKLENKVLGDRVFIFKPGDFEFGELAKRAAERVANKQQLKWPSDRLIVRFG